MPAVVSALLLALVLAPSGVRAATTDKVAIPPGLVVSDYTVKAGDS